jgi:hypothetical protein
MGGSGETFEELGAENLVEVAEWEEAVRSSSVLNPWS